MFKDCYNDKKQSLTCRAGVPGVIVRAQATQANFPESGVNGGTRHSA